MKALPVSILALAFSFALLLAQENFEPPLDKVAERHRKAADDLRQRKDAAFDRARAAYRAALANAEKSAITAGDLKGVAAITSERKALDEGLTAPATPPDLPRTLHAPRRNCLEALARVNTDFGPRQQRLAADYLRDLAGIEVKAGPGSRLATQIAAEKQRILIEASGAPGTAVSTGRPGSRSVVINGDFSGPVEDNRPAGWKPAYPGGNISVIPDGANAILRLQVADQPQNVGVSQDIPVPAGAQSLKCKARVRGKPTNPQEKKAAVQMTVRVRDDKGAQLPPLILTAKASAAWQTLDANVDLPANAKSIELVLRAIFATGTFDFDDASLEFK